MNDVKNIVHRMLTANTGRHFLDSGDAYGRNWEKNQGKTIEDFEAESEERIEKLIYDTGVEYLRTVNVFHFLAGQGSTLSIDDLCERFNAENWNCEAWDADADVYGVCKEAWAILEEVGVDVKSTWNTYNGESDLSQVLQGSYLDIDGEDYLLVQVHGGCDVRGGYTDAQLFRMDWDIINEYLMDWEDSYMAEERFGEWADEDFDEVNDYRKETADE